MRRTKHNLSNYQSLESRQLLAGDVSVGVVESVLNIVGDSLANEIEVSQEDSGSFVITGIDTTVNGSSSVVVANSFQFMSLFMGAGDDSVSLNDVNVSQNISFYGDEGSDRLTSSNALAWHLHAEGGVGNDVFELDMRTRKSAYLYLGEGDDTVALATFNAGRNFKIFAGAGNDTIAADTVGVGRRLEIELDAGDDSFLAAGNTSIRNTASVNGAEGSDFIAFNLAASEAIEFSRRLYVEGGTGDDNVSFAQGTLFDRVAYVDGGDGTDSISTNGITNNLEFAGFENETVPNLQALLDGVYSTLNDANIDPEIFGGTSNTEPLTISNSEGSLTFVEGDEPLLVDGNLTISGDSGASISAASVSIDGFASGEDVLSFDDTASTLAVSFDNQTGVLSMSGADTIATYQAVLRTVIFDNESDTPTTDQRTIRFSVTADDETVTGSRVLNVVANNTAPTIDLQNSRSVTTAALPVTLDSTLVLADADNAQLSTAIVQIADGRSGDDVLEFDALSGINATFDASTGTLTVSGDADVANYQSFLRNVRFASTNATAGSRTIRFTVGDGIDTTSADISLQITQDA